MPVLKFDTTQEAEVYGQKLHFRSLTRGESLRFQDSSHSRIDDMNEDQINKLSEADYRKFTKDRSRKTELAAYEVIKTCCTEFANYKTKDFDATEGCVINKCFEIIENITKGKDLGNLKTGS